MNWVISIVSLVMTLAAVAVGVGVYKQIIRENRSRILCQEEKTENQERRIQKLENQFWDENKLYEIISKAIERAMLKMENAWLKDGLLHKHEKTAK